MSLCLGRLAFSPYSPRAMRLAGSPDDIHALIVRVFDGPTEGRVLFRVDATERGPDLLIQAPCEPDWTRLDFDDRDLREAPASKPLAIDVEPGTPLSFRLLARPVRRASKGNGKASGSRNDLRTDEERLAWLHRKAEAGGFRVISCGLSLMTYGSIHSELPLRRKGGSFTAVRFDGELVVTDVEAIRKTVSQGIGTQKAFGFGLLSLGRI